MFDVKSTLMYTLCKTFEEGLAFGKKTTIKKSRTTKQKRQPTHPNEFSDSNQLVMMFSRNNPVLGVHKRQLLKCQYQQPKSGFILKTPKMWCVFFGPSGAGQTFSACFQLGRLTAPWSLLVSGYPLGIGLEVLRFLFQ